MAFFAAHRRRWRGALVALAFAAVLVAADGVLPGARIASVAFVDVIPGDSQYDAIMYVQRQGIVSGYADGSFRPNQPVNRAEFVKMLMQRHPLADSADACANDPMMTPLFSDIDRPAAYWYGPLLCVARREGIIGGYPDGSFRGGNLVNAAEAAKIIVQSRGLPVAPAYGVAWYEPFIQALRDRDAWPERLTRPDQRLARADMAEILYRLDGAPSMAPSSVPAPVATSSLRPALLVSSSADDVFVLVGSRRPITSAAPVVSAAVSSVPSSSLMRSSSSSSKPTSTASSRPKTSSLQIITPLPRSSSSASVVVMSFAKVSDLSAPTLPLPATWGAEPEGVISSCLQDGQGYLLDRHSFGLSADGRFLIATRFANAVRNALRQQLLRWDREHRSTSVLTEDVVTFDRRRARITPQGDAVVYASDTGGGVNIMLRNFRNATPIVLVKEAELEDPAGVQPLIAGGGRYVLFTVRENGVLLLRVYDRQAGRLQSVGAAKDDGEGTAVFLPPLPQLLYVVMAQGTLRTFDLEREVRSRNLQPKSGVEQVALSPVFSSGDGQWSAVNLFRTDGADALYRVLIFGRDGAQTTLFGPADVMRDSDFVAEPDDTRWQLSVHGITSDGSVILLRLRSQGRMQTVETSSDAGTPSIRCVNTIKTSVAPVDPHAACAEIDRLFLYDWRERRVQAVVADVQPSGERPTLLYMPSGYPHSVTSGPAGEALSADGRYVVFMLDDDARQNLLNVDERDAVIDTLHNPAIFLYDRQSHGIERILESTCARSGR